MESLRQFWSSVQTAKLSVASWLLLALCASLQYIFSLPHAIALRKLFLLIAFVLALKFFWEALRERPKPLMAAVLLFVALQVWMLVVSGFIANQPLDSLSEWKGQWLSALMAFFVGIGLARALMQSSLKNPATIVVLSILIPIIAFLSVNALVLINGWIGAGEFIPSQAGIGDHKGVSGYLVALLEPILIADLLSRFVKGQRIFPVPAWVISGLLIFAVGTLVATTNRNGILVLILTFMLFAAILISEVRNQYSVKKIATFVLATIAFVLAIAITSYKIDTRWQSFIETIPIAWDIDHDLLWLNGDDASVAPVTPSGKQVDISQYSRIAWAHEGWRMFTQHPWGMEIARDTFRKLELEKYGRAGMSHSHNSWIDFGLNVGIPGLILWASFLVLLARQGWAAWQKHKDPLGLALAVLVTMFAVRGMLDSIFRDHELEQFLLVTGSLFGALSFRKTDFNQG